MVEKQKFGANALVFRHTMYLIMKISYSQAAEFLIQI